MQPTQPTNMNPQPQLPQFQPPPGGSYQVVQTQPNTNKPHVPYSKGWYATKIVLECLCLIAAIVALGCACHLNAQFSTAFSGFYLYIAIVVPPTAVSLCWTTASLITTCARKQSYQGIHPGAQVALHLLLWMGYIVAAGLTTWMTVVYYYINDYVYYDYDYSYGDYYEVSQFLTTHVAMVVFLYILALLYFILFVRACVETSQYNQMVGVQMMMVAPQAAPQASSFQPQPVFPAHSGGGAPIYVVPGPGGQQQIYVPGGSTLGQQQPIPSMQQSPLPGGQQPYVPAGSALTQQQQPPKQQSPPPTQSHASWVSGYNQGQMSPHTNNQSYGSELSTPSVPAYQQQNHIQQSGQGLTTQAYEMAGDKA